MAWQREERKKMPTTSALRCWMVFVYFKQTVNRSITHVTFWSVTCFRSKLICDFCFDKVFESGEDDRESHGFLVSEPGLFPLWQSLFISMKAVCSFRCFHVVLASPGHSLYYRWLNKPVWFILIPLLSTSSTGKVSVKQKQTRHSFNKCRWLCKSNVMTAKGSEMSVLGQLQHILL